MYVSAIPRKGGLVLKNLTQKYLGKRKILLPK